MSFEKQMQDLRSFLDIEDALSTKTEQLLQAVELEHAKALPKKRAAVKKVVPQQRFSVALTERGSTNVLEFDSENSLNTFLKNKRLNRVLEFKNTNPGDDEPLPLIIKINKYELQRES